MLELLEIPEILAQMVIRVIIMLTQMVFIMPTVDILQGIVRVDVIIVNMGKST
jgi:hypothetical protein